MTLSDKARSIYLPVSLLQFLEYQQLQVSSFKKGWRQLNQHIWRGQVFQYNTEVVHNYKMIQYILPQSVLLNPDKVEHFKIGIDELKFACICHYPFHEGKIYIKLELQPHDKMIIFAACGEEELTEIVKEIIVQMQALLSVKKKVQ